MLHTCDSSHSEKIISNCRPVYKERYQIDAQPVTKKVLTLSSAPKSFGGETKGWFV